MGAIAIIAIGVSIALSAAAAGYAIYQSSKIQKDGMGPAGLDSFNATHAQEGLVVPIVYGRVRVPGNIIWYGNVTTIPMHGGGGGKGGKKKSAITGYKYYVDCWQAICMGKVSLVKLYINDTEGTVSYSQQIWNDGTMSDYPTAVPKANKLPGVAHIFWENWYIGENSASMPNVHFILDRVLPATVDYANMANGNNPAAILYDLLTLGGIPSSDVDLASFNTAALGWYNAEIALNFFFTEQTSISDAIDGVLKYIDAMVYVNNEGKYAIKGFFNTDSVIAEISEDEMKEFSLNRKTWSQIPNDFPATFVDESLDFTQRVVRTQNIAAIAAAGAVIQQSIDLKCFRDVTTASKRLFEIMLEASYPAAELKFKTSLAYSTLLPGDIIRITYPSLGIVDADFRVTTIDNTTIDKNEVGISARQKVDGMFSVVDLPGGGSSWEPGDYELIALTHIAVFELPFNYSTLNEPAYLILCARERLIETGFAVMYSNTELGDYAVKAVFEDFAQYGTLDEEYLVDTYDIDDTVGILYTPYKFDPEFVTQSRTNLFGGNRVAICGNEMMGFEKVVPEGPSSYRLLGIVRGVFNTPIEIHAVLSSIWLVEISENNVLTEITASNFWIKPIPVFEGESYDAELVSAVNVVYTGKAITPDLPGRIVATRAGSNVDFEVFPGTWSKDGAGTQPEDIYSAPGPAPYVFEGDFEVFDGALTTYETSTEFSLTLAGQATVTAKHRISGRLSDAKEIIVGAQDGVYYA